MTVRAPHTTLPSGPLSGQPSGIVVLDKPLGVSSNAAMAKLKRLLNCKKMGFLGTLDPLATGVLPVFVGKATRLIPLFEKLDKHYRVTCKLGITTDSYDAEGQLVEEKPTGHLTPEQVAQAALSFQGEIEQTPPVFSALKVGGRPAYKLARQGAPVALKSRRVRLFDTRILHNAPPDLVFLVGCSSGTYMRSLVHDIGQKLGVGATLTGLVRESCGNLFLLENSYSLNRIEEDCRQGNLDFLLNPAQFLTGHLPLAVDSSGLEGLRQGKALPLTGSTPPPPATPMMALDGSGGLLATGQAKQNGQGGLEFRPDRVLV